MSERIVRLNQILRKAKLEAILKKAAYTPEDEENPAYNEPETENINIVDQDISDLDVTPTESDKKEDRLELIRERHEALKKKREKEYFNKQKQIRVPEVEYTFDRAVEEFMNLRDNYLGKPGYSSSDATKVITEEMNRLKSAYPGLEEAVAKLDVAEAESSAAETEEERQQWEKEWEEAAKKSEEPAYDRAKDEAKNEQAREEMEESIRESLGGREYTKSEEISVDDVLVLAETMYSFKEAKSALNNMSMEELKKKVMEQAKQLGLFENKQASTACSLVKTAAAEDEDENIDDQEIEEQYKEYKGMSLEDKISGASYVELYALSKFFSKQLKEKAKKERAKELEEEKEEESAE